MRHVLREGGGRENEGDGGKGEETHGLDLGRAGRRTASRLAPIPAGVKSSAMTAWPGGACDLPPPLDLNVNLDNSV
jgi:hypothetical protein